MRGRLWVVHADGRAEDGHRDRLQQVPRHHDDRADERPVQPDGAQVDQHAVRLDGSWEVPPATFSSAARARLTPTRPLCTYHALAQRLSVLYLFCCYLACLSPSAMQAALICVLPCPSTPLRFTALCSSRRIRRSLTLASGLPMGCVTSHCASLKPKNGREWGKRKKAHHTSPAAGSVVTAAPAGASCRLRHASQRAFTSGQGSRRVVVTRARPPGKERLPSASHISMLSRS